jgi:hypothetical protein
MGSESIEGRAAQQPEEPVKRLTRGQTAIRDALIVQRVTENWPWAAIAEEAGVSSRQAQRILKKYRENMRSPLDTPPTELIEELAVGYRGSVAIFTQLAATADNTAAAVGAIKGANDAREKFVSLMQAIGHIPNDLGTLKLQRDVEQVARQMLDAIERFRSGELDADALEATFYDIAGLPPVPTELPRGDGDAAA